MDYLPRTFSRRKTLTFATIGWNCGPHVEFLPVYEKGVIFIHTSSCFFTLGSAGSGWVLRFWNPGRASGMDICTIFWFGAWKGLNGRVGHFWGVISSQFG